MGDRANIVIEASGRAEAPIFFYTHWSGSEIKPVLQSALKRGKDRWQDTECLPRIIFCEMVKGNEMDTTGFGISTVIGDGEHNLLCVNIAEQKVKERDSDSSLDAKVVKEWTFQEFCDASFEDTEEE